MIVFSNHALLKLEQRGISKKLVREAIKSPDYIFKSYSDREVIYIRNSEGCILKLYLREKIKILLLLANFGRKNQG